MSIGLPISCQSLLKLNTDVKLFNGQEWEIRSSGKAFRYVTYFVNGKSSKRVYFGDSHTRDIFPQIKVLYDKRNRQIATRLNVNARLLTTRHNSVWTLETKEQRKINEALYVYALVEAIETKEYTEAIQNYWNNREKMMN